MKKTKTHKTFAGVTAFWEHDSIETKTPMTFSTFVPAGTVKGCLIWLSGLTCTAENFITKAGAQKYLADVGMMVICPDTSPRGLNLPHEHDAYDFGSGAGFYVDATTEGYADHYRMDSYVTKELFEMIQNQFKVSKAIGIAGHSMGGHGALVLGLREPQRFQSVSAFSPIAHPTASPWGQKAFQGYLGSDQAAWKSYDATELILSGHRHPQTLLIDQGEADEFLDKQLMPKDLLQAANLKGQAIELRYREGYDHSYYFIATFIREHIEFHARQMGIL
jgi:S-formylglutathione hydrolase